MATIARNQAVTALLTHLAFIMDGNRRWAKERGLPTFEGHRLGYEKIKEVVGWAAEEGIKYITFFAFSTENWNRSKEEVAYLTGLIKRAFTADIDDFKKAGARVKVIGRREGLSPDILECIEKAENETADNTKITVNIAFNYGGRAEILDAVKSLLKKGKDADSLNETDLSAEIYTAGQPDPDLIVRTSGEQRLSGFLLWQSAYSEFLFVKKYWPEFSKEDFEEVLAEYHRRERRFGK